MKRLKSRKNIVTDRVQLISIECQLPATPARHTNVLRRIRTKVSSDASCAEEERVPVYRFRFPRRQRSIHFSSILSYPLPPFISLFSVALSLSFPPRCSSEPVKWLFFHSAEWQRRKLINEKWQRDGSIKVETRAPLKGTVIKTAKLLLINLAGHSLTFPEPERNLFALIERPAI